MHYKVISILDPIDALSVCDELDSATFSEIEKTRGSPTEFSTTMKHNLELKPDNEQHRSIYDSLTRTVLVNSEISLFSFPKNMRTIISRYEPTMFYDDHVDSAIMPLGNGMQMRTDISFTLFLSPPESYIGGALELSVGDEKLEFRCRAGQAVVYDSGVPHRVHPVLSGKRVALVGWIESHIRRTDYREMLRDLDFLSCHASVVSDVGLKRLVEKLRENFIRAVCD